jgi:hypothetical protein
LVDIFWSVWKTRNRACFYHVMPNDPTDIQFHIFYWIDYWASYTHGNICILFFEEKLCILISTLWLFLCSSE